MCFNIGSFIGNLSPNSDDKKYSLIAGDKNFIFSGELYFFLELNILCKCLYTSCLYLFEIKNENNVIIGGNYLYTLLIFFVSL